MKNGANKNIVFNCVENGSYLDKQGQELRQKIYGMWMPEWTAIYKGWGSSNVPNFRDFMLYDYIHCLTVEGQVAGISAHRFMSLDDALNDNTEYFQSFGKENIQQLKNLGLSRIMTFESLLVAKDFRKSLHDFQVSKLLLYLANKTFSISHADGIVGTGRKDVKAPDLALALGYEVVEAERKVRDIPCDLLLQRTRTVHYPEDPSYFMANSLWNSREIHTCESSINRKLITNKKAA